MQFTKRNNVSYCAALVSILQRKMPNYLVLRYQSDAVSYTHLNQDLTRIPGCAFGQNVKWHSSLEHTKLDMKGITKNKQRQQTRTRPCIVSGDVLFSSVDHATPLHIAYYLSLIHI